MGFPTTEPSTRRAPLHLDWEDFNRLSGSEKAELLSTVRRPLDLTLLAQQFDRTQVERVFSLANRLRSGLNQRDFAKRLRTVLADKSCTLYFPQCSTRTFVSFSLAAQSLGMIVEEIRDPEFSAEYKGESEIDTLLALAQLSDLIVAREGTGLLLERFAFEVLKRGLPVRIINGGSGADQHPTQALLELYTLQSYINIDSPAHKRVAFIGDLKRSRTARSLAFLLSIYPQVEQVYVAPNELQIGEDVVAYLNSRSVVTSNTESLDEVISEIDAMYLMRIQDEYGTTSDALRERYSNYYLTPQRIARMKKDACVVHPLPRRDELPPSFDHDPRAAYWTAVSLGKVLRMALILTMFDIQESELMSL
jgi:aspartate carbamoyltransferase catalytic subunit